VLALQSARFVLGKHRVYAHRLLAEQRLSSPPHPGIFQSCRSALFFVGRRRSLAVARVREPRVSAAPLNPPEGARLLEQTNGGPAETSFVRNLLRGQYDRPVRVLALNVEEGWVRDVPEIIAAKVRDVARREEQGC
jgi:hypothetical protein